MQQSPGPCVMCGKRVLSRPEGRYQAKRYCSVTCWEWAMKIEAEVGVKSHQNWHRIAGPVAPANEKRKRRKAKKKKANQAQHQKQKKVSVAGPARPAPAPTASEARQPASGRPLIVSSARRGVRAPIHSSASPLRNGPKPKPHGQQPK